MHGDYCMIYILIFVVLVFFTMLETNYKFDEKNRFFNFLVLILILLIGTRDGLGADYYRYEGLFQVISADVVMKSDDIGFASLAYLLKCIGFHNRQIFLAFAGILCLLYRKVILDNLQYKFPALLLFYSLYMFPLGFNAMAQGIAVMIMMYSIRAMKERKTFKIIILTVLAVLFHSIGLLNVVIWFIMYKKLSLDKIILLIMLGFLAAIGVYALTDTGIIEIVLQGRLRDIYTSYFSQYKEGVDIVSFMARVAMLIFVLFGAGKFNDNEEKIFLIYLIGIMVYIALLKNSLLATRINLSLKIVEVFLISSVIKSIRGKQNRFIYSSALIVFLFVVFASALSHAELNPYKSWLF